MNSEILVEQFCTPPEREETNLDKKAFTAQTSFDIEFENRTLKAYSLGTGPNVLLAHGWGSRASHLLLIARYIANKGFRVIVFDGPAHGKSRKAEGKDLSNMFEWGKAISCVAKSIGDIYAVIGHSLGAMASALTISGTGQFSDYQFSTEKLILISTPVSVHQVFDNYSRNRNELELLPDLAHSLEHAFNFKADDYDLRLALGNLSSEIMVIHDDQDEEVPISDALSLKTKFDEIVLKQTSGYGHQKILVNRRMLGSIGEFLVL